MNADVIVIGGGASGLLCSIMAAKRGRKVLLLEGNDRIGKKILATGNGRCNFTHEKVEAEYYNTDSPELLSDLLRKVPTEKVLSIFRELGMLYKNKNGYYYPYNEASSTVLDVLRFSLEELAVTVKCESHVTAVRAAKNGYLVEGKDFSHTCEKVVLCCGSKAGGFYKANEDMPYRLGMDLGLRCSKLYPALTRVNCFEKSFASLSGVRANGEVSIFTDNQLAGKDYGEIQFTKTGLSGIVIFQLSALAAEALENKKEVSISCDYIGDSMSREEFNSMILQYPNRKVEDALSLILHKKIIHSILGNLSMDSDLLCKSLNTKLCNKLWNQMTRLTFRVKSVDAIETAQVCHGGFYLNQFDENLQAKKLPGVYVCGEALNVDGICGGYNLHFAWATGYLAGLSV